METKRQTERAGAISLDSASGAWKAAPLHPARQAGGVRSDPAIIPEMKAGSDALRGKPSLSMIGLLLVEMIIGYEWLVSGVAKFVRGGIALLVGPFIWLCAWDRVSDRVRAAVLFFTAVAAIGGTFLVNSGDRV